jgi:hypothetical protein
MASPVRVVLDHPHSFSFIFYFKTEYSIPPIHILSFIITSSAFIVLHISPSSNNPHRDPPVILSSYFNTRPPTHRGLPTSLSFLPPRSLRRASFSGGEVQAPAAEDDTTARTSRRHFSSPARGLRRPSLADLFSPAPAEDSRLGHAGFPFLCSPGTIYRGRSPELQADPCIRGEAQGAPDRPTSRMPGIDAPAWLTDGSSSSFFSFDLPPPLANWIWILCIH